MRGAGGRIAAASPVHGLARRTVGFFDVLGQSVAALAPSAAATTIPMLTFAVAGAGSALAVTIAALIALGVAASINVFAKRVAAAGSVYTFVSLGLGPRASVASGAAMLVGYGLIAVFELFAAAHFVGHAFGAGPGVMLAAGAALGVLLLAVLLGGIRLSTRLMLVVEVATVVTLVAVIAVLLTVLPFDPVHLVPRVDEPDRIVLGVVVTMSAFVGFESAAALGVEAKRPFATIPRVLLWTVAVSGAVFVFVAVAGLVAAGTLGFDRLVNESPFDTIAQAYGVGWAGVALDVLIGFSFFAAAVAASTAFVRILFSMSREGTLPRAFGRTHRRTGVPMAATLACVPLVVAPVALRAAGMGLRDAMDTIVVAAVGSFVLGYVLVCAAVPPFLRRIGEATAWPVVRAVVLTAVLGASLVAFLVVAALSGQVNGVLLFGIALPAVVGVLAALRSAAGRPTRSVARDVPLPSDVLGGARTLAGTSGEPPRRRGGTP
ncbi:APC family permease [Microbacterium marinilacus]|uniref:APC family permease n=1 Tax=Microbacterium marinilacus TaxID=415209 RepID=A0ABP7BTU9_9MICO|nr:APC family permease [Microbacterium marinilacus]MBY0688218.1 APC family permease [Microbacterium marinilacus]